MKINEAVIGATARELITGYTGVIVGKTIHLNGCHRVILQPAELDKDGEPFKSLAVDIQQVEVVADKPVVKAGSLGLVWGSVKLGTRVRDLITPYEGIVIAKTEWFGGKLRATVMSQKLSPDKTAIHLEFDVTQLDVLDPKPIYGDDIEAQLEKDAKIPGGPYPDPVNA